MKRALSLVLAVVLSFGMAVTASAAPSGKITGVDQAITETDYTDITVKPGKVIELPLTADIFSWEKDSGTSKDPVTESQLSSGKVTVKVSYEGKSKNIIDSIDIASKKFSQTDNKKCAYIKIKFKEDYISTDEIEFDFTVYLAYKTNRVKDSAVQFSGTYKNETVLIEEDDDYVDMSGGEVFEPESYLKNVECYLGNGLYMKMNLFEGRAYYGVAEEGIKVEDEKIMNAYPDIEYIYTLKTVNMGSGKVYFDLDEKYYVYDEDGSLIGTTRDETLKYSSKYYLSKDKLTATKSSSKNDDDDDDDDDDEIVPTPSYDDDDDDLEEYDYPSSGSGWINDNPTTGTNGFLKFAAFAGLIALAVIGASGKKHR